MLEGTDDPENARGAAGLVLLAAGDPGTGQYRCADCGYGITIHAELPECPMCGGAAWEETAWSPITNAGAPTGGVGL